MIVKTKRFPGCQNTFSPSISELEISGPIWSTNFSIWSTNLLYWKTCERLREGHYLVLQAEEGTPPTRSWFVTENISATTRTIFLLFVLKLFSVSSLTRHSTFFGGHAATELRNHQSLKNKCGFCLCVDSMLEGCCSTRKPPNFTLSIKFAFRRHSRFSGFSFCDFVVLA